MTSPAAARNNKYGNRIYPVPKPGTMEMIELPSVTSLLELIAKPGLETWKRWKLAMAMSQRPDLVALSGSGDLMDNGVRTGAKDAVKQAEAADQSAANKGTGVHYWAEQIDNGTIMWEMVPEPIKATVEAYAQAKEDHGWVVKQAEFTCYSHTYGYAGTADQFTYWPKYDTKLHTTDIKTSKAVYADYALQLGAYTFADGIWVPGETPKADAAMEQLAKDIKAGVNIPPTPTGKARSSWTQAAIKSAEAELQELYWDEYATNGRHLPMPDDLCEDVAFIIHVSEGHCEVVPLYITGLRPAVAGIAALSAFINNKLIVGDPISPHAEPGAATPAQISPAPTPATSVQAEAVPEAPAETTPAPSPSESTAPSGSAGKAADGAGVANTGVAEAAEMLAKAEAAGTAIPEPTEAELPPAVDEFQPEPPAQIPVAPQPSAEQRVKVYRDRIAALPVEAKQKLAFGWPAGVPTFKQTQDHTDAQLGLIDALLWSIECEFDVTPFGSAEEAAVNKLTDAFAGSAVTQ